MVPVAQSNMASVENLHTSNREFLLTCEVRNVPVAFMNAVRRILISDIPTVVLRDVEILENTTQMPHEMLKHRFEQLPINVHPSDAATIRDAKIELRVVPEKSQRTITTADFVVESGRETILMRDRDLDTPLLFLYVRPGEAVHVRGRLQVDTAHVSQVCTATTAWHVDPELAKADRKTWVDAGKDVREFDNFYVQRSYSRDAAGRPNWFDLSVESVGVLKSREILKVAVQRLRRLLDAYFSEAKESIRREQDEGSYTLSLEQGGHTLGALLQEVMYSDKNVGFASYDVPHPLRNTMVIRFNTKKTPESVLANARASIEEYCAVLEKSL
jgi:DNA-directed RNA polymerase subunit L